MLYDPLWVPTTLRWARFVVVPTTGPRSAAVGAPQWIGREPTPPLCDVNRMWPVALSDLADTASADMAFLRKEGPAARHTAGVCLPRPIFPVTGIRKHSH